MTITVKDLEAICESAEDSLAVVSVGAALSELVGHDTASVDLLDEIRAERDPRAMLRAKAEDTKGASRKKVKLISDDPKNPDQDTREASVRAYCDAIGLGRSSSKDKVLFYSYLAAAAASIATGQRYLLAACRHASLHQALAASPPQPHANDQIWGLAKAAVDSAAREARKAAEPKKRGPGRPKKTAAV